MKKTLSILLSCLLICALLVGCAPGMNIGGSNQPDDNNNDNTAYPVKVESLGQTFVYNSVPERVVVLDYISAQVLVALGLGNKIVALAPSMNTIDEVKEEYRDEISALKMFPSSSMNNGVPSLEIVLTEEPDIVIGTAYAFNGNNVGAVEDFLGNNVNIYASEGTYVEKPTLENVYNDIANLGKIFDVSDEADALISTLRAREKEITDGIGEHEEITVFNFDTNMNDGTMYTVGGSNLLDSLFVTSGVKNIFGNLGSNYSRVSLEEIISLNPDYVIVTKYYTEADAQEKIDYFESTPELADVTAVTEDNYIVISGICLRPGLQTLDALDELVKTMHTSAAK